MDKVACFHKIGEPTEDKFTHSIDQILAFDGIITFDGAYSSVYEHRIELAPRQPILFVQGETVAADGICTSQQIEELAGLGFVLGWHGWTHRKLTDLPDHAIVRELSNPDPDNYRLYAYPHGDWDERTAKLVKQMGYLKAYSTTQGEEGNDFAIPRMYV